MITRRFVVHGRVQGVGFRWFVARQAARLGVVGFARNLEDGSVEVVAQGEVSALESLAEALRRGPAMARVSHVETTDVPHDLTSFGSFETH
jgi:acylphosphatase